MSKPLSRSVPVRVYDVSTEYRVLDKVGRGAYGTVYKVKSLRDGLNYAIKKLDNTEPKLQAEGFPITALREIQLLKQFNHINVIGLKEIIVSRPRKRNLMRGSTFLVFEYMDHDLAGLLKSKTSFSLPEVKCIVKQLLEGVNYLHESHIMHRDIKSANILLRDDGVIKLADFGLSRKTRADHQYTHKVVTLWYRAPELLLGCRSYSNKVDVWSVGCVFAEMLIGDILFKKDTQYAQLERIYEICGGIEQNGFHSDFLRMCSYYQDMQSRKAYPIIIREHIKRLSPLVNEEALDLLSKMLALNPANRLSAREAIDHKFFSTKPLPCAPGEIKKMEYQYHEMFRDKAIRIDRPVRKDQEPVAALEGRFQPRRNDAPFKPKDQPRFEYNRHYNGGRGNIDRSHHNERPRIDKAPANESGIVQGLGLGPLERNFPIGRTNKHDWTLNRDPIMPRDRAYQQGQNDRFNDKSRLSQEKHSNNHQAERNLGVHDSETLLDKKNILDRNQNTNRYQGNFRQYGPDKSHPRNQNLDRQIPTDRNAPPEKHDRISQQQQPLEREDRVQIPEKKAPDLEKAPQGDKHSYERIQGNPQLKVGQNDKNTKLQKATNSQKIVLKKQGEKNDENGRNKNYISLQGTQRKLEAGQVPKEEYKRKIDDLKKNDRKINDLGARRKDNEMTKRNGFEKDKGEDPINFQSSSKNRQKERRKYSSRESSRSPLSESSSSSRGKHRKRGRREESERSDRDRRDREREGRHRGRSPSRRYESREHKRSSSSLTESDESLSMRRSRHDSPRRNRRPSPQRRRRNHRSRERHSHDYRSGRHSSASSSYSRSRDYKDRRDYRESYPRKYRR